VAEGVGRRLDPSVNMWSLAQPLIEEWMRENRGVEARVLDAAEATGAILERLPTLLGDLESAVAAIASGGLRLDAETVEALGGGRRRRWGAVPLWIAALALLAIALAMW